MNILHLAFQVGLSKKLKRTGWVMNDIKNPESVADHCYRVSILAMALAPFLGVDQQKFIKMAVIHDLGETSTGDLVTERANRLDKKKRKVKEKIEKEAIRSILYGFEEDYAKLFQEMIERKSKEANIFWQIDKLEMAIQAYEYEKSDDKNLQEFMDNAKKYIKHPVLKKAFDDLQKMRNK
ncbi:HD domain-containing protein [Patescibacteria group bacterium]|nr:HD domain-containing protein [Patescibacteria group bacterium]